MIYTVMVLIDIHCTSNAKTKTSYLWNIIQQIVHLNDYGRTTMHLLIYYSTYINVWRWKRTKFVFFNHNQSLSLFKYLMLKRNDLIWTVWHVMITWFCWDCMIMLWSHDFVWITWVCIKSWQYWNSNKLGKKKLNVTKMWCDHT